ncbi:hybrid sensor histidine kinase/response regulator [Acanthopleuribacter pedis]|uniref:histidine kinase n=1 Tax=Acanthopleuribacter pedis TaxID=442870 RepID=A0A8J7QH72_9BACT|nr:hybrid sensor histidine kinase/response regulator [Acanthopleuribacter pedis]MBO1318473.1 response regulator [Acanthopleuribacter pedis]
METPPLPANEKERLADLNRYDVLDTEPETVFDDLTMLAKNISGCPIALISLVDETRQWFKSKQGLEACETSRDISFCGHVIVRDQAMTVADAAQDPRFADNPLVIGGPLIRFYHGVPLRTPNGNNIGTLCVIDQQPRQLSETQLASLDALGRQVIQNMELRYAGKHMAALAQQAGDANEAKSRYLATISHDIRTPIGGILGMTDIMLTADIDPETRDNLESIRDSADFLMRLLDDLLEFSKIEAGKITLEDITFKPKKLIQRLVTFYRPNAEARNLVFEARLGANIPTKIVGDPHRLEQVLINLITNAIKFTHQGGVWLHLDFVIEQNGIVSLTFAVRDSGIGISQEQAARIFRSYSQANASTARQYGGVGLGLSIAKHLVELMGGTLQLSPNPDGGSIFTFTLPFRAAPGTVTKPVDPVEPEVAATVLKVLVVEDEPINQKIFALQIEHFGHRITCVNNGREALTRFGEEPFDLVLVDLNLPDQCGFAVAEGIRARAKSDGRMPPIFGVTACLKPGDRERGANAKMDNILIKPIELETLALLFEEAEKRRGSSEDP